MRDIATYSGRGGFADNTDALLVDDGEALRVVMCDGRRGPDPEIQKFCTDAIIDLLRGGNAPEQAVCLCADEYARRLGGQAGGVASVCAAEIRADECTCAGVGDVRLYRFSGGSLVNVSSDTTQAYAEYAAGRITYEQIRLRHTPEGLNFGLGSGVFTPSTDDFHLSPGDALLMCSDGFWQFVFETEMELDLSKSADARTWLDYMLLRLTQRSHLDGDNFTVFAYIHEGIDAQ